MTADPGAERRPILNIIGCGRAAGSLAQLWLEADCVRIGAVHNRSKRSSDAAVARIEAGQSAKSLEAMPAADLWMLGCGDDQVESLARNLCRARADLGGCLVFHLAGRFGRDVLDGLAAQGAVTAALHPVRSLTHQRLTLADFAGTACVAECAPDRTDQLHRLVTAAGGIWLPVEAIDRGLYHAAVSIISNVTKAVAWKAQNWLQHAGLPKSTAATVTHQLLHSTMRDLFRSGARQSITGPVVRGDTRTVEAHLAALEATHPGDTEVYRVLARTVLELAQERGDLEPEILARFDSILLN